MAKNTVNGKAPNSGELKQIGTFLKQYLNQVTVDMFLKVLKPCCNPVILSATATCVGGGLYNIDLTFSIGDATHVGGLFISVKGANGNLYILACDIVNGVITCTGENIPLEEGIQDIQVLVFYAPIIGQGDPQLRFNGFVASSAYFPVQVDACP